MALVRKFLAVNPIGSGFSIIVSGAFSGETRHVYGVDFTNRSGTEAGQGVIEVARAASGQTSGRVIWATVVQPYVRSGTAGNNTAKFGQPDGQNPYVVLDGGAALTARTTESGQILANVQFAIED